MGFPNVNLKLYLGAIDRIAARKHSICCFCGTENITGGEVWVCYNCELSNYLAVSEMRLNDQTLVSSIAKIDGFVSSRDYAGAATEYEKQISTYKDPEFLYSCALFYMKYSNAEVSAIAYDRKGFMEENAQHRDNSLKLYSKSTMLLSKASLACDQEFTAGRGNVYLAFTLFMINIKLRNMKTARRAKGIIEKYNNQYLLNYAGMVFNAQLLDVGGTASAAMTILNGANSMNGAYYLAWALFRERRYGDATKLLSALSKYIDTSNVSWLMKDMATAQEL